MSVRLVALVLAGSLLFTGCGPIILGSDSSTYPQESHDDTGAALFFGTLGVVALISLIPVAGSPPAQDAKEAAAAPAPRATGTIVYYAPSPAITDQQLALQRMYVQGQVLPRAGRCDGVQALGRKIAQTNPGYFQLYAVDPVIAPCMTAVDK